MPAKRKRSVADYLKRIGQENHGRKFDELSKYFHLSELPESARPRRTGTMGNISGFGRVFVGSFPRHLVGRDRRILLDVVPSSAESQFSVALRLPPFSGLVSEAAKFEAKLGFRKETVFLETFQGPRTTTKIDAEKLASGLNKELGTHWPNFLLKKIEQHARRLGFRRVIIPDPSTSEFFRALVIHEYSEKNHSIIDTRVRELKRKISKGKPLVLSKDELSALSKRKSLKKHIKGGRLFLDVKSIEWNNVYTFLLEALQKKEIQQRMRNFIGIIAKKNGYVKRGNVFVKEL